MRRGVANSQSAIICGGGNIGDEAREDPRGGIYSRNRQHPGRTRSRQPGAHVPEAVSDTFVSVRELK